MAFAGGQSDFTAFLQICSRRLGLDARSLRSLRQQAGCRHARQRVRFQAPEIARSVLPKVDATVAAELERCMRKKRVLLRDYGLALRQVGGELLCGPTHLVFGLIVEYLARDDDFADRQSLSIQHSDRELAASDEIS